MYLFFFFIVVLFWGFCEVIALLFIAGVVVAPTLVAPVSIGGRSRGLSPFLALLSASASTLAQRLALLLDRTLLQSMAGQL